MNVGELRKKLEGVQDEVEVVGIGHFGEGIRTFDYDFSVKKRVRVVDYGWATHGVVEAEVFAIPIIDDGGEPC